MLTCNRLQEGINGETDEWLSEDQNGFLIDEQSFYELLSKNKLVKASQSRMFRQNVLRRP